MSSMSTRRIIIELPRKNIFFLAAFFSSLFSRIGIVLTGYTSDDYAYALDHVNATWHSIHQGRFLSPLLFDAMTFSGFTQTAIQIPLFIISLFVLSALIAKMVDMTLKQGTSLWLGVAAAAIAGAYPYLTSYYLFRMVILDEILVYSITLLALHVLTLEKISIKVRIVLVSLIVGFGSGDNQLVFMLFSISAMASVIFTLFEPINQNLSDQSKGDRLWRRFMVPATIVIGFIIYIITIKLVQKITGIPAESSYSIHASQGLLHVFTTDLRLIGEVLWRGESIIPFYLKASLLIILLMLTVQALVVSWKKSTLCLLFLFFAVGLSVAPLAVSSGGFVARIFMCTGFSIALFIALLGNLVSRPKTLSIALIVIACFYGFSGAMMFYQQHVLSEWDQKEAWSIYTDIARQFDITEDTTIHLINGSKIHGLRLSTYGDDDYGVNESALRSDWSYAYPGLFKVATGKDLKVTGGAAAICLHKPAWPKTGSIFLDGPTNIDVCL